MVFINELSVSGLGLYGHVGLSQVIIFGVRSDLHYPFLRILSPPPPFMFP